ncbi:DUF779 domain-containing protein [Pueribacillus sp. YX66]|uniref:DUF779 domain-containing protein n=1 Tax=Pueribacillus sp. YX66 TaxID=3229242 RepID=UPI00358D8A61
MKRLNVSLSKKATAFLDAIQAKIEDDFVMFIGSGCCDGPVPQLFKKSETIIPTQHEIIYTDNRLTVYFIFPMKFVPTFHYTIDLKTNVINDSLSIESRYDCQFVLRTEHEKC